MKKTKTFQIDSRYLMIPQSPDVTPFRPGGSQGEWNSEMAVSINGRPLFSQELVLRAEKPWWWAGLDLTPWQGMTLEISCSFPEEAEAAFDAISLEAELKGMPNLYHEPDRPQFHFSYRHGALGDPTAMVYYAPRQEWHIFTIHNPFRGKEICWGHAVSSDLLNWEERSPILYPGHLIWNGVGFTDSRNILDLNRDGEQAMVLLTPIMGREGGNVSMTVSVDGGETFTDMNVLSEELGRDDLPRNPIAPGQGDAPRIYWNPVSRKFHLTHCRWEKREGKHFVTSLQFTSTNLVDWARIEDFPLLIFDNWPGEGDATDVIELSVDGDESNRILLIMCGRNGYALGRYSESGLDNLAGEPLSPRDTIATGHFGYPVVFSGAPGGRGIIMYNVGNDRMGGIPNYEMGYKPNLSFPLELSLRSTSSGPRLYQNPIPEIEQLYRTTHTIGDLCIGETPTQVRGPEGGLYRLQAVVEAGTADEIDLTIMGYTLTYSASSGTIRTEGDGHKALDRLPGHRDGGNIISQEGGRIKLDVLIDRTSIEILPNDGERYIYYGKLKLYEHEGAHFSFVARGGGGALRDLRISEMGTIWCATCCGEG